MIRTENYSNVWYHIKDETNGKQAIILIKEERDKLDGKVMC